MDNSPTPQHGIDRSNPAEARRIIEKLLPDPEMRRAVLQLMVECIHLNAPRPAAWGTSLHSNNVTLNVGGGAYVVNIYSRSVGLTYLPVEGADVLPTDHHYPYKSPDARRSILDRDQFFEWLPRLHDAILGFVRSGERFDKMNGVVQGAHSPGVLRYIEDELQLTEPLPDPVYPASALSSTDALSGDDDDFDSAIETEILPMPTQNAPLNQILFGPPGTGKTYNTVLKAVQLLYDDSITEMADARPHWERLRREGRIEFVTFHQSYGYEDFIEGLRPVLDDDTEQGVRYEIKDGVLKRIALRALGAMLEPIPVTPTHPAQIPFDTLWERLVQESEEHPEKHYPGLTSATNYKWVINQNGRVHAKNVTNTQTDTDYSTSRKILKRLYDVFGDQEELPSHTQVTKYLGVSGHHNLAATVLREMKRIREGMEATPTATPEDATPAYERAKQFLEKGQGCGYRPIPDPAERSRYVLVMDEINRGNISKIFGELITLIEADKRVGAEVALDVTLPLSDERFALPPNLYLLGTMNTADKSIALVDIALRRRFSFIELMPDFTLCRPPLPDSMRLILTELNRRITLYKDRDHQIGHAYFMKVADEAGFNRVWREQIRPLLAEYFYNDWEMLRNVLGEDGTNGQLIRSLSGSKERGSVTNQWEWHSETDAGADFDAHAVLCRNYSIDPGLSVAEDAGAGESSDLVRSAG